MSDWLHPTTAESLRQHRERIHRDLVERLKWRYPGEDPIAHIASPESVRDISVWYALGKPKRSR